MDPDESAYLREELQISTQLCHPNVCTTFEHYATSREIYLIMEHAEFGGLSGFLKSHQVTEPQVSVIMRQIFEGLEYLHTCGITHKDLKPDNILVTSADPLTIKLTDFGLSELTNRHDLMIAAAGTPVYVSPELIKKQGYTSLTDVWACGVILYQMVAHKLPFRGVNNQQTLKAILNQEPNFDLPEFETVSASCKSFIEKCL